MLLDLILLLLILQCCLGEPYLVSLKLEKTFESFYAYDTKFPPTERVRDLITNTYSFDDFNAFSGNFPKNIIERLEKCEFVAEISPDAKFKVAVIKSQPNAPKHLARVNRRTPMKKEKKGEKKKKYPYIYDSAFSGQNVNVYVIDSGIQHEHPEFTGRARMGKDFTGEGGDDLLDHGSYVAGIIGSATYGISKSCNLINVKVVDKNDQADASTIIAAIEFIVKHHKKGNNKGVVNLSIGVDANRLINRAVKVAKRMGLVVVAAAGNDNVDACTKSPAGSPHAITVGAINDVDDSIASFSNWGKCVDFFAIGTNVASVNPKDDTTPEIKKGTSMSAPVVTGLVANLLSKGIDPGSVKHHLLSIAIKGKIPDSRDFDKGTRNIIAHSGIFLNDLPKYIPVHPSL
ncbi:uncharacterized protein SPAPADRAFT_51715 [Spathaspora passalidarum NRRL Y-27907]|uniref:Peptidase S8/S53 domain-containing protein n=1 Tax=Spathaspora passalidarum (strain NRRL Y-27907 / 11-Y1) TaxID=619300 RepID=G3ARC6_SPAPN|nr:uncharacterized protein SPAPADRAFT_51715 [Spathaspora passalidarum NRRL Y-27907]EGW31733.1 hypothetical protein SPAPADRAFT_51715 [Spathaspora passalidarum NRRL Y-27907]